MIFDYNYQDFREMFENKFSICSHFSRGADAEATWLYDMCNMQYDERNRLIALLPLIKWEVEHDMITCELYRETRLYYEDYKAGKFKGLLGDDEIEEIEKDLFWSYEHMKKPEGIEEYDRKMDSRKKE